MAYTILLTATITINAAYNHQEAAKERAKQLQKKQEILELKKYTPSKSVRRIEPSPQLLELPDSPFLNPNNPIHNNPEKDTKDIIIPLTSPSQKTKKVNIDNQSVLSQIADGNGDDLSKQATGIIPGQSQANGNGVASVMHSHSGYRSPSPITASEELEAESLRKEVYKNTIKKLRKEEQRMAPVVDLKKKFVARLTAVPEIIKRNAKDTNETVEAFTKKMFFVDYKTMTTRFSELLNHKEGEEPIKSAEDMWTDILKEVEEAKTMQECYKCCKCSIQ